MIATFYTLIASAVLFLISETEESVFSSVLDLMKYSMCYAYTMTTQPICTKKKLKSTSTTFLIVPAKL